MPLVRVELFERRLTPELESLLIERLTETLLECLDAPELKVERVRAETAFERVESYPEYPGIEHPMRILARVLAELGIKDSIGGDQDGYPGILGYEGPALSAVTGGAVAPVAAVIESMMV